MDDIGHYMESIVQAIEDSPGVSVIIAIFILWRMLALILPSKNSDVSKELAVLLGETQKTQNAHADTLDQQTEILDKIAGNLRRIETERTTTANQVNKIVTALAEHNEQQDTYTTNMFERLDGVKAAIESVQELIKTIDGKIDGNTQELDGLKPIMNIFSERLLKAQVVLDKVSASIQRQELPDTKPLSVTLVTESPKPNETAPLVQVPE